jgi:cardiolipin synthase
MPFSNTNALRFRWFQRGDEAFQSMCEAIDASRRTVRLEVYIYTDCAIGRRILGCLSAACARGVEVRVLIDSIGALELSASFWEPLIRAGGTVRWFNPLSLERFAVRDHRKLLVCDGQTAFLGGYNVDDAYDGDGVEKGWFDIGVRVEGLLAFELGGVFDVMFSRADLSHDPILRLRKYGAKRVLAGPDWSLLLSGPGRGKNPVTSSLLQDLRGARDVVIITPYFLPPRRLRSSLVRVVRRGGRVRLILPSKTDVALSQLAARSLYRRLLRSGIEIFEYQPQVLHAKMIVVDSRVYAGSSNLDPRSLRINYELMMRFENPAVLAGAQSIVNLALSRSQKVELEQWIRSRSWWQRLRQRWAYFLLARLDPLIASWEYRRMIRKQASGKSPARPR